MSALLEVILPVFLVLGFGWIATWRGLITHEAIDALMRFAQNFAVPCLLFRGVAGLDLASAYQPGLMLSFYIAALAGFGLCLAGARWVFGRPLTDSVAIGFAGMFSNSLLLGVPITERAYGSAALAGNYAIISIHSALFYTLGIGLMEWAQSRGAGLSAAALGQKIARAVLRQPMVIGIMAGFAVNLSGLPQPQVLRAGVEMMSQAAIPVALFALGGILLRYRPEGDRLTIAMICVVSLILHPLIGYALGRWVFDIGTDGLRSVVMTAAMAPGVNAYVFANLYGVARRVNATAVVVATALSIPTIWFWLHVLP